MSTYGINTAALKQAAERIWSKALSNLGRDYTRQQLASALVQGAKDAGMSSQDVRFTADYGLALSGFGGGL